MRSVKLKHFSKFADTAAALNAASAICEGTLDANLKTFLQESVVAKDIKTKLAVADSKLGSLIKESLGIKVCVRPVLTSAAFALRLEPDENHP